MRGLVLEGGGAKGAYHVGAVKALMDSGYTFDGVAGTSIGAINGAILMQEDGYEKCLDLWTNIRISDIVDIDNEEIINLFHKNYTKNTIKYWALKLGETVRNLGMPTDRVMSILRHYIDEDMVRSSGKDFVVMTYSLSDRKPIELRLSDIPHGMLHEYIFASAYYPLFRLSRIDGKYYIDGGVYDNLPVNVLARMGEYDEIIAVRTKDKAVKQLAACPVPVKLVVPSEPLGSTMELDPKRVLKNIKLGYYDAMRMIKGYLGRIYYFEPFNYSKINELLYNSSQGTIDRIVNVFRLKPGATDCEAINAIYLYLKKEKCKLSDEENFLYFMEKHAFASGLEKFNIYSFESFIEALKENYAQVQTQDKKLDKKTKSEELFEIIMDVIWRNHE